MVAATFTASSTHTGMWRWLSTL